MSASTLLASGSLAFASAAGFLVIARYTLRGLDNGGARLGFATFWMFSAAVAIAQGTRSLSAALGLDSFALIRAMDQTATPAYCIAAAGLLYYVSFLLTGRRDLAIPIGLYYLLMIPLLRYSVEVARPIGYVVRDWQVNLVYETSLQSPTYTLFLALTAGPVILAVVAYAFVLLRVHDDPTRYRVACIAIGLVLWLATEMAAWASGLVNTFYGEIGRRLVGLLVTAVVMAGYLPPASARKRWGAVAVR